MSPGTDGDLRARVLRSGGWTLVRLVLFAVLQILSFVVLFRLLEPEDFGVLSIATVVLAVTHAFSQTGIDLALVRHPGEVRPALDAYFTLQVVRGLVLGGIVAAIAAPIAAWQDAPILRDLLLVSALVPVLEGLRGVSPILFNRALEQRRPALVDAACALVSFAGLLGLALWLRSPWAIVWNQLIATGLRSIAYHAIHPVRPRLTRHWGPLRPFIRFGIGYHLAQSTRYLVDTVDRLLVGRFLGMHPLGIYDRAHTLAHYGLHKVPLLFSSVVVPAFSRFLTDPPRFRRLARRFLLTASLGGAALAGGVRLLDEPLLRIAAGDHGPELLPFFQILLVAAVLRGIALLGHVLLDVIGRPQIQAVCNSVQVVWLLAALPFAFRSGGLAPVCGVVALGAALNAALTLAALAAIERARRHERDRAAEAPSAPAAASPARSPEVPEGTVVADPGKVVLG